MSGKSRGKRGLSSRTILGIVCILFALLLIFLIVPFFMGSIGGEVEIVRVKETIYTGEEIVKGKVETVKVHRLNLPTDVIRTPEEVIGKISGAKLLPGDYILKGKLSESAFGNGNYLMGLDGKYQAISVSINDLAAGLSGKLLPGDIVTVLSNAQASERASNYPELKYLKVIAVTLPSGLDASGEATSGTTTDLPATVTLLANPDQVTLLTGLEKADGIYFSLIYRGDQESADKFLMEQENYFKGKNNI